MNPINTEVNMNPYEVEKSIESMELRLLEAIWSLERGVLDQMQTLQKIRETLDILISYMIRHDFGSGHLSAKK